MSQHAPFWPAGRCEQSVCSLASMKWINSNSQTAAASLLHWNSDYPPIHMYADRLPPLQPSRCRRSRDVQRDRRCIFVLCVWGLLMQTCFASHYMAAMQNMHHLDDCDECVRSSAAARSPAAARTQLASSWASGCWLLAPIQIFTERRKVFFVPYSLH